MKILHVAPYFAPAWAYGGTPRAVYELACQQVKDGHQVTVLTTDALDESNRARPSHESIAGIKVIRVRNLSHWLVWKVHFVTPISLPREIQLQDFNVVHLHETRVWLHVLVLLRIKNQTVFFSPWGTLPYNQRFDWIKRVFDIFLMPQLRSKVVGGLGQTQHEVQLLKEAGIGQQQTVVPLGVAVPPSHRRTKKYRELWKVTEQEPLFLFLGRYAAGKGIDVLLQGFAEFRRRFAIGKLVLVGRDDGSAEQIRALIRELQLEDVTTMAGPLYADDRWAAYQAADVFTFVPTIYEETSTACLEALLCDTPVITSYQAEIPFLKEASGVHHIESDSQAVADALAAWWSKKLKLKPNSKQVMSTFSWSAIGQELTKLYEKDH